MWLSHLMWIKKPSSYPIKLYLIYFAESVLVSFHFHLPKPHKLQDLIYRGNSWGKWLTIAESLTWRFLGLTGGGSTEELSCSCISRLISSVMLSWVYWRESWCSSPVRPAALPPPQPSLTELKGLPSEDILNGIWFSMARGKASL